MSSLNKDTKLSLVDNIFLELSKTELLPISKINDLLLELTDLVILEGNSSEKSDNILEHTVIDMGSSHQHEHFNVLICQICIDPVLFDKEAGQIKKETLKLEINKYIEHIFEDEDLINNVELVVFPELTLTSEIQEFLLKKSDNYLKNDNSHFPAIIGGCELKDTENRALVLWEKEKKYINKLHKSKHDASTMIEGRKYYSFENTRLGNVVPIICFDFLDDNLIRGLKDIDILVIVSFNKDIETFRQRAKLLSYDMDCFIIIVNNGYYGGSSIYAPVHGSRELLYIGPSSSHTKISFKLDLEEKKSLKHPFKSRFTD